MGVFAAGLVFAHPKISKNLEDVNPETTIDVIVQYKSVPTASQHNWVIARGGLLKSELNVVRGAAYRVKAGNLAKLAEDPAVEQIVPDYEVRVAGEASVPLTATGGATMAAWSDSGWGDGVGVAVIDSGISVNQDLSGRIVYSKSFVQQGTPAYDSNTADAYGHGTHVAGIIASSGAASRSGYPASYFGSVPQASLVNLRVLDGNGSGRDSDVIAAIQQAIALQSRFNIRVMNLSLGRAVQSSYKTDPLCQAVEAAWKAGITVVVAAGNYGRDNTFNTNGYATITAPGNDPYVITVGAMNDRGTYPTSDDVIASYSSKGPTLIDHIVKPDVVAPGNLIVSDQATGSTLVTDYPANKLTSSTGISNQYFILSGTSMATPFVSGGIAILVQNQPYLTPDSVKARVMKTASKAFPASSVAVDRITGQSYTSYYDIFTVGAGYVNFVAAYQNADISFLPSLSPTADYSPSTGVTTLSLVGSSVTWGSSVLWGSSVIWGSNVLSGNSVLWGSSVIWGSSTSAALSVIWGSSVPLGNSVTWGSTTPNASSVLISGDK
jgi:serine protease AprX